MIYLTGASGYLGQHIVRLGGSEIVPVPRDRYDLVRGQVVIHAGWPMLGPHEHGVESSKRLVSAMPRFVLYVGTQARDSYYAELKGIVDWFFRHAWDVAEHVVRFPGLFGPPRRSGLMYAMTRAALRNESFQSHDVPPDWTGMRVEKAAQLCLDLARAEQPGLTIARDEEFEEWLTFCRASS